MLDLLVVQLIAIMTSTVAVFITALSYMIVFRVIFQLFLAEDSKVLEFCYAVTEPVVSPVRNALSRFGSSEDNPVDFSYIATFLILLVVQLLLPPVVL